MLIKKLSQCLWLVVIVAGPGLTGTTILANGAAPRGNYVHEKAMRIKQSGGLKQVDVAQFTAKELNQLREADEVGLIVAPSTVRLPQALSKVWFKSGIDPQEPGSYALANIIDSGVVDGQVVVPVDGALLAQSVIDSLVLARFFAFGTTWLGKTWADATPEDTFTVYSEEGVFFRDMTRHYHFGITESTPEAAIESVLGISGVQDAFQVGIAASTSEEPDPDHVPRCHYWNDSSSSQYYLFPYDSGGVDAYGAWDLVCEGISDNKEIVIGIDDNGFGTDPAFHPDIRYNVSPKSRAPFDGLANHGTAVAGVCAATVTEPVSAAGKISTIPDGAGIVGLSPRTKMVLRDHGGYRYVADLKYLIDSCELDVINFSWGISLDNRDLRVLLERAFYGKNIALVAGAGNCSQSGIPPICPYTIYPGSYSFVLAVSGSKPGVDSWPIEAGDNRGSWLDVVAPSRDVLATGGKPKFGGDSVTVNYGYSRWSGTSFSSSIASGVVALLKTANPNLPAATIYDILAQTAIPLQGQTAPWTDRTGWGQIDARGAALRVVNPPHCDSLPGDADGDCFVNWGDARLIVNYLANLATLPVPNNADVNGDCSVDFSDFSLLVDYLTHEGVTLLPGCFESEKKPVLVEQAAPEIEAVFPNPFNPVTTIRYSLPQTGRVSLEVYNTLGQLVRTLVDEVQEAGSRSAVWDGTNNAGQTAASGVYMFRLSTEAGTAKKKMVLLK